MQKRGNNDMETQSSTVSDCLRSIKHIFVHLIRFHELEASIGNEKWRPSTIVAMRILLKQV